MEFKIIEQKKEVLKWKTGDYFLTGTEFRRIVITYNGIIGALDVDTGTLYGLKGDFKNVDAFMNYAYADAIIVEQITPAEFIKTNDK